MRLVRVSEIAAVALLCAIGGGARALAQTTMKKPHLIVVVDALHANWGDITRADDQYAIDRLKRQYPGDRVVIVESTGIKNLNHEIFEKLEAAIAPDDVVDSLLIGAHGGEVRLATEHGYEYYRGITAPGDFYATITNPKDVGDIFGPVVGKFAPDAKIAFFSCEILKEMTLVERLETLKQVAKAFGLKSGRVYANEQEGEADYAGDDFYRKQGYGPKTLWFIKVADKLHDLIADYRSQRVTHNNGYTLALKKDGSAVVYYDYFFNALAHTESLQEQDIKDGNISAISTLAADREKARAGAWHVGEPTQAEAQSAASGSNSAK